MSAVSGEARDRNRCWIFDDLNREWTTVWVDPDEVQAAREIYNDHHILFLTNLELTLSLQSYGLLHPIGLATRPQAALEEECEYVGREMQRLATDPTPEGLDFWRLAHEHYTRRHRALEREIARRDQVRTRVQDTRNWFMARRRIPKEFVERLKAQYPLEEMIVQLIPGTQLRRRGNTSIMLCPFHADQRPSCTVYRDHFHCFSCNQSGDIFDIIQKTRTIGWVDAVIEVASAFHVAVPEPVPYGGPARDFVATYPNEEEELL